MISPARIPDLAPDPARRVPERARIDDDPAYELERLRAENRRLAVSLGGFSAFMASRGLLEEAWSYVHTIHQIDEG
jgi:hypothetical protein